MKKVYLKKEETGFTNRDWYLNPMQVEVHEHRNLPGNLIICAATAAGKTTAIHMRAYRHLYPKKGRSRKKLVYVAPMKALVEEKRRAWSNPKHPYSKFKLQIVTGDYTARLGDKEDKKLAEADVIVITPESLASRLRNRESGRNGWLSDIGLFCVDEIHLIGEEGRGANLEAVIMEFTAAFPRTEILGLSATMPNARMLAEWLSSLNKLETYIIESDYRPTKLNKHFKPISAQYYDEILDEVSDYIVHLCSVYTEDTFLICFWNIAFGEKVQERLERCGFDCDFHHARRDEATRAVIEKRFGANDLQYVLCTKTLMVGIDGPADRVICTAWKAGGKLIPASDLNQAAGRAGRRKEGNAHFCIPAGPAFEWHKQRILTGEPILSQLNTPAALSLHFLGALNLRRVEDAAEFVKWYRRSFRHFQHPMYEEDIDELRDKMIDDMQKRSMIKVTDGDEYVLKRRGIIANQMSIDPYYLYDLAANFKKFWALNEQSDIALVKALSECGPFYARDIDKWLEEKLPDVIKRNVSSNYWAAAYVHYLLLKGEPVRGSLYSIGSQVRNDIDRIGQTLMRLNAESENWEEDERVIAIAPRIRFAVDWKMGRLIGEGCSVAQAKELLSRGVESLKLQKDPRYKKIIDRVLKRGSDDDE